MDKLTRTFLSPTCGSRAHTEMNIMTSRALLQSVARTLNWQFKSGVIFPAPVGFLLRGVCRESSGFSRTMFDLAAFVQPLWMRREYIVLSYGGRLRDAKGRWGFEVGRDSAASIGDAIAIQAMPFLESIKTPLAFAEATLDDQKKPSDPFRWSSNNPLALEAAAYGFLLAGDFARSIDCFDRLLPLIADDSSEEIQQMRSRSVADRARIIRGDYGGVVEELKNNRLYTANALGIDKFLADPEGIGNRTL